MDPFNPQNELVEKMYPTGSYYICNPPVTNTDIDFLVLAKDMNALIADLLHKGWVSCAEGEEEDWYKEESEYGVRWTAYRYDNTNVMITEDSDWYYSSVIATEYCKTFNVQNKERRIRIFRFVKYKEPLQPGDLEEA